MEWDTVNGVVRFNGQELQVPPGPFVQVNGEPHATPAAFPVLAMPPHMFDTLRALIRDTLASDMVHIPNLQRVWLEGIQQYLDKVPRDSRWLSEPQTVVEVPRVVAMSDEWDD